MTPRIGAARSSDRGATGRTWDRSWKRHPIRPCAIRPTSTSTAGSATSASCSIPTAKLPLFGIPSDLAGQGVAMARMAWADRDLPAGRARSGASAGAANRGQFDGNAGLVVDLSGRHAAVCNHPVVARRRRHRRRVVGAVGSLEQDLNGTWCCSTAPATCTLPRRASTSRSASRWISRAAGRRRG